MVNAKQTINISSSLEIEVLQQIGSLEYSDSTASVKEHPPFSLNLLFNAQIILIVLAHHLALPYAVMLSHFEIKFRVAVHYAAFFHHSFERTCLNLIIELHESK